MQEKQNLEDVIYNIKQLISQKNLDNEEEELNQDEEEVLKLTNVVDFKKQKNIQDIKCSETFTDLDKELSDATVIEIKKTIGKLQETINTVTSDFKSKTIEELVLKLIKPHIINWLDDNLLNIVKSIVEDQIKKIVSKQ